MGDAIRKGLVTVVAGDNAELRRRNGRSARAGRIWNDLRPRASTVDAECLVCLPASMTGRTGEDSVDGLSTSSAGQNMDDDDR